MANLITVTAVGKNGIARTIGTITLNVSRIKEVLDFDNAAIPSAATTIQYFDSLGTGSTVNYQVEETQAEVADAANAALITP